MSTLYTSRRQPAKNITGDSEQAGLAAPSDTSFKRRPPDSEVDLMFELAKEVVKMKSKFCRLHHIPHATSQLTTSQGIAKKLGLQSRPTPHLKERD